METQIISLIASVLKVPLEDVNLDTEIGELDEWDSLHNMQIFMELEQTYKIKFTPELLIDLEDVSDIIELVKELAE